MSTLPANFKIQHKRDDSQDSQTVKIPPKPLRTGDYHAYICQDARDSKWTDSNLANWLENCGYLCAEYHRDVLIGEKVLDVMCNFLFTSDKTVIILSESFVKSPLMMYQMHLAVRYCIDHNCQKIITLHVDDCDLPPQLTHFERVKFDPKQDWKRDITNFLNSENKHMPKEFCTDDTHVSTTELFKTARSVMSEPATLDSSRNALRIPDNIKTKIKIWYRSKSIEEGICKLNLRDKENEDKPSTPRAEGDAIKKTKVQSKQEAALTHALNIRSKGKQVFEATMSTLKRTEEDPALVVEEGEVLEILEDKPVHGNLHRCANATGSVGLVSKKFLVPSNHYLPSRVVQMTRSAYKSPTQNAEFKQKLLDFECPCYQVVKASLHNNTQQLSVLEDDILFLLTSPNGGRAKFKNCLNETGYVFMDNVLLVPNEGFSYERASNISAGSEGYGSETGDSFQADC